MVFIGPSVCGLWYPGAVLPIAEKPPTLQAAQLDIPLSFFSFILLAVIAMMIFMAAGKTGSELQME